MHGEEKASLAQAQARAAFGGEGEMPEKAISKEAATLTQALVEAGLCKSNGEARRLVEQGALPEGEFTLFKGKKVRVKIVRK